MFSLSLFLHLYQTPTQSKDILEDVVNQCYRPLFALLKEDIDIRISLNIQGCLIKRLKEEGYWDILEDIKYLVQNNVIELAESAAYHPILPFLSKYQIRKQIEFNREILSSILGLTLAPLFYPPELYFSPKLVEILAELNIPMSIVSENIDYGSILGRTSDKRIICYKNTYLLKRDQYSSDLVSLPLHASDDQIIAKLTERLNHQNILIVVDGEVFGHHFPERISLLQRIFSGFKGNLAFASKGIEYSDTRNANDIYLSSWESIVDYEQRIFTDMRWRNPHNEVHVGQWKLLNIIQEAIKVGRGKEMDIDDVQKAFDFWVYSCQFWWAGAWPFWHPQKVLEGAYGMYRVAAMLPNDRIFDNYKKDALIYYTYIVDAVTRYDLSGKARELVKKYDQFLSKKVQDYEHSLCIV